MSLRIGIDARELGGRPTGTGRYLASLLEQWIGREDLRLHLFTHREGGTLGVWQERVAVTTLRTSHGTWFEQALLPRALGRTPLDVFFAPAFSCPLLTAVPRVTAVHDLSFFALPDDFAWLEGLRRRLLVGASIRASTIVLTLSDFMRGEIAARFPDAAEKLRVVPLAADPVIPPAGPACNGGKPPLLVSVGSLFNRRWMPELLEACAILRKRGVPFQLRVLGDNRTHPRWDGEAQAAALGLGDVVTFGGYAAEAERRAVLGSATVALYLSRYEGFGLPALEALASGIPLIVSDDRPLNELFGSAAAVVDATSPAHLADGIAAVLADPKRREEMRRRGRALASSFSWPACAEATLRALREAAA